MTLILRTRTRPVAQPQAANGIRRVRSVQPAPEKVDEEAPPIPPLPEEEPAPVHATASKAKVKQHTVLRNTKIEETRIMVDKYLKSISEDEHIIDMATARLSEAYAEIQKLLEAANIDSHSNGVHLAEIVEQWTRQGRTVKPQTLRNHVTNEVFWKSLDVSLGRLGEHLTATEINAIADIVPSTFVGKVLKVKKIEPKKLSRSK